MLFLHGILGTPRHFDFILPLVPGDWSLWTLLLPGHGEKCRDFSRSNMGEWSGAVEKALDELRESHERIFIVAHSMGTLLAVRACVKNTNKIAGIFALAMPLKIGFTARAAKASLHICYRSPESDSAHQRATREATSISLSKNPFSYIGWVPRFLELFALSGEIRRAMPLLKTPCLAIQSALDELVSIESLHYTGKAETILLRESSHYLYSDRDMETIKNEFKKFICA